MILYLNRWLCLHFGLPLQYGGWRPLKLDELVKYVNQNARKRQRWYSKSMIMKKFYHQDGSTIFSQRLRIFQVLGRIFDKL